MEPAEILINDMIHAADVSCSDDRSIQDVCVVTYLVGRRIGQFDRYDMCTDTFWTIYDISYDTLHVAVLLRQVFTYMLSRCSYSKHFITCWYETLIEYTIVEILNVIYFIL